VAHLSIGKVGFRLTLAVIHFFEQSAKTRPRQIRRLQLQSAETQDLFGVGHPPEINFARELRRTLHQIIIHAHT
jgi:hypothetical protein